MNKEAVKNVKLKFEKSLYNKKKKKEEEEENYEAKKWKIIKMNFHARLPTPHSCIS